MLKSLFKKVRGLAGSAMFGKQMLGLAKTGALQGLAGRMLGGRLNTFLSALGNLQQPQAGLQQPMQPQGGMAQIQPNINPMVQRRPEDEMMMG